MAEGLLEPPASQTPADLAEWLEATMLVEGIDRISQAEIEERIPSGQSPGASIIEEMASEIGARADLAPEAYPFRVETEEVYVDPDIDARLYRFLLVLSMENVPYKSETRFNEIGPYFELITREAGLSFLAEDGRGLRFGWPRGDGRPEHLIAAVKWLAHEMGLQTLAALEEEVDEHDKDGGVDVIVWHDLGDRSKDFPVWLFQCTVQSTQWEKKAADAVPDQWASWIDFTTAPQIGLAVPHVVPENAKARYRVNRKTGLLFERFRLCRLASKRDLTKFEEWDEIAEWTDAELALIVKQLSAPPATSGTKRKKPPRAGRPARPVVPAALERKGLSRDFTPDAAPASSAASKVPTDEDVGKISPGE